MVEPKIRQPVPKKKFVFPDYKAHLIFWPLAIAGLALDLWSKWAAFDRLEEWEVFPVIDGFMQFVTALNDGAVWGSLSGKYHFLAAVSIIAMVLFFLGYYVLSWGGDPTNLDAMLMIARNMAIDLGVAFGLLFIPGIIGASLTSEDY